MIKPVTDLDEGNQDAHDERFHLFDPWLVTTHPLSKTIAGNIALNYDQLDAPRRKRRPKQRDIENRTLVIHAIFANMAYAKALDEAEGRSRLPVVGISLRAAKRALTRYDRKGFASLSKLVEVLSAHAGERMFTLQKSRQRHVASTITASPHFARLLDDFRLSPDHFQRVPGGELIWLSRTRRDFVDDTRHVEVINYEQDTTETIRYRAEMTAINAHLTKADFGFIPDGGPLVIVTDRQLQRQFKLLVDEDETQPHFDLCGRMFGGWWQRLKSNRRQAIRINGEPVADLDFSNMFLRLAYIAAALPPPQGDLYADVAGLSEPRWRPGVKTAVSAMLCRNGPMQRLSTEMKGKLPPRMSASQVRAAILESHAALAPIFETGVGLRLMFTESQILVSALLRLTEEGVTALPMHDGLMVARSKADIAAKAMGDAAEAITGHRLPISLKSQY